MTIEDSGFVWLQGPFEAPANASKVTVPQEHDEIMILIENWTNETQARKRAGWIQHMQTLIKKIRNEFSVVADFEFLGMFFVNFNQEKLQALVETEGVICAIQFPETVSRYDKLLRALDILHKQSCFQAFQSRYDMLKNGVEFPNDDYEGGVFPAKADSKIASLSPNPLQRNFAAFPAIMPVINISFGPKNPTVVNPMNLAVTRLSETHLITIAAGNSGRAKSICHINNFVPDFEEESGVVCVGATTDESGSQLANYSSTGLFGSRRRPCVVADGRGSMEGEGTSFSAPKVATYACLIIDAVLQVVRVLDFLKAPDRAFGVSLVGWGMVDDAQGRPVGFGREELNAMPFLGVYEGALRRAFKYLASDNNLPWFSVHGAPVRQILMRSARKLNGRGPHEMGAGFVNEQLVIDYLSQIRLGELLKLFCNDMDHSRLPNWVCETFVFERDELYELSKIASSSRVLWTYDLPAPGFFVNRNSGNRFIGDNTSHALKVAAAAWLPNDTWRT